MRVDADRAYQCEQEYARLDLDLALQAHRELRTLESARDVYETARLARWWGSFETNQDVAITQLHSDRATDALVGAWLGLQEVMATSPADRTAIDVDAAEARIRDAIFLAEEWGLVPGDLIHAFDPEGKF